MQGLLPTVCFSAIVPQILKVYRNIAERLTAFEDHASTRAHADALTRKTFALNSIVAYAGLTLSAFVYIPFGRGIMTGVDQKVYKRATGPDAAEHKISQAATEKVGKAAKARGAINKGRLQDQVRWSSSPCHVLVADDPSRTLQLFAYTVTNQVINAFLELGLPVIMRKVAEYRGQTSNGGPATLTKKTTADGPTKSTSASIPSASVHLGREIGGSSGPVDLSPSDTGEKTARVEVSEEERKLLAKIEKEAELPVYDLFSASTLRPMSTTELQLLTTSSARPKPTTPRWSLSSATSPSGASAGLSVPVRPCPVGPRSVLQLTHLLAL